ncbi:hypothetical protein HG536_0A07430 [Torulaspora globosa]|uniref:Zn(2)-C6 fungal-type domain-containing protein n=1 Tax=Torulaspora globosa TaxID=48254 RepID=A0A7G3ZBP2_9SACH|nr:uncharacterized protein HG536_0A07430 [Torulaspora globosa]QLL30928.1 hypothetical protein HG536_0A07430 [Torulaspora globosa]
MSVPEKKRKKNGRSCVFCRRSHLICDDQRPCTRCVKRDIAHLCTDENGSNSATPGPIGDQGRSSMDLGPNETVGLPETQANVNSGAPMSRTSSLLPQQPTFVSEHVGSEFSSLNEFLNMLEDPLLMNQSGQQAKPEPEGSGSFANGDATSVVIDPNQPNQPSVHDNTAATPKEHFFLTAADPSTEMTPENRLKLVINAKLEAGLLQPYNYAQGYSRLQNYMDKYMNQSSKQRILKPLSTIRPAFRAIARSLKDVDLVLVEEGFERMLLSYDRVFTSMSMPACLWRRTGEIYRANKEFASLVDCTVDDLRDGRLAIYELMTEESAVNFWEKYGSIAFDKGQKAVLTSCNLRTRDGRRKRPCCFSFTIRRDRYNIPICIVGNFIPIS